MKLDAPEYMTIMGLTLAAISVVWLFCGCASSSRRTLADSYVQCVHDVIFPTNTADGLNETEKIYLIRGCEVVYQMERYRNK